RLTAAVALRPSNGGRRTTAAANRRAAGAAPALCDIRGLEHALRLRDTIALCVVDAETAQHVDDFHILGTLPHGLFAGQMTDLVDGSDHFAVDGIVQYLFDETAVDLQVIHREVLQVTEGRQAGTEVVERELAAQFLQRLDEAVGLGEARDRGGLRDFEADLGGIQAAAMKLIDDVRQKLVVAQALTRQIDRAHREFLALIGLGHQPPEGVFDDPPIDLRGDSATLGRRDEIIRRDDLALLVAHAQQQLVMRTRLRNLQRQNGLAEDLEPALLQRIVDARGPLHLAAAAHQIDVVFLEAVHAVAAGFLGRLAGAVGGREYRGHIGILGGDRHDADARSQAERALLPGELEVAHRLAKRFGRPHGLVQGAALEQYAEFVAAQTRQRVAPADLGFEQRADLAEQGVAGAVSAGV